MHRNPHPWKSSLDLDNDDDDHQTRSRWLHENCARVLFVFLLTLLSIGTATSLVIVLYTDAMKEKALAEKRKGWIGKWNVIKPYVKKFPLGFVLGFIRNLIVLAIDRQSEL